MSTPVITLLVNDNDEILTTNDGNLLTTDNTKGYSHLPANLITAIASYDENPPSRDYSKKQYAEMTATWLTGYRSPII